MFKDRFDAAHQLVPYLKEYSNNPNAIVLAIPRGGLELGYVIARELHLLLDIILTKKIGYPGNPEYAIGAVSLQNIIISQDFANVPELQGYIMQQASLIRKLLHERNIRYRGNKTPSELNDKIIIVVDDGVATGNTLMATLSLLRKTIPKKLLSPYQSHRQQYLNACASRLMKSYVCKFRIFFLASVNFMKILIRLMMKKRSDYYMRQINDTFFYEHNAASCIQYCTKTWSLYCQTI